MHVSITTIRVRTAELPVPTLKATTIGEVIGNFVAWPKRLIEVVATMKTSQVPSHILQGLGGKKC